MLYYFLIFRILVFRPTKSVTKKIYEIL